MINDFHPLVSIVIPVYNGSNYMQCAIDSALGQDYDNIEVIVVNDGSTDNTEEIAKSYGERIRYFSKENGGVSTALNLAIKNANGEYISWLSHDDYYLPNKVSRQIEELKRIDEREKIIIISDAKILYIHGNKNNDRKEYIQNYYPELLSKHDSIKSLLSWDIHGCSLLIPKDVFKTVSYFDETLKTTQDYYLWFKFIHSGYNFFFVNKELLVTRTHEQQNSNIKWDIAKYEQLNLWNFVKKTFKKEIKENEEIRLLLEEKLDFFKKKIKISKIKKIKSILKSFIPKPFLYLYRKLYKEGIIC